MKDKDQILWEEKRQLAILADKKLLKLETDLVISSVCVNYLITAPELNKKFAIIKGNEAYERDHIRAFRIQDTANRRS